MESDEVKKSLLRLQLQQADAAKLVSSSDFLRGCPLVVALSEEAPTILRQARAFRFTSGGALSREGEATRSLFLVLEGEARLCRGRGPELIELAPVLPGRFLGEEGILRDEPRRYSAIASGELIAAELDAAALAPYVVPGSPLERLFSDAARERWRSVNESQDFLNRW